MESKIKELYEKESGKKCPNNQMAFMDWHTDYIKWIEQKLLQSLSLPPDKEVVSDEEIINRLLIMKEWLNPIPFSDVEACDNAIDHLIKKLQSKSRLSNVKEGETKEDCNHKFNTTYTPETGTVCSGCKQKLISIQVTEKQAKQFKRK